MSRSTKKPYYKDKGMTTHEYWSIIRREWKSEMQKNYFEPYFRDPKEIINDWKYSDYRWYLNINDLNRHEWSRKYYCK